MDEPKLRGVEEFDVEGLNLVPWVEGSTEVVTVSVHLSMVLKLRLF